MTVVLSSLKCTICVICIYKLKWLEIWLDIVSRTLDIIIDTLGSHRKKVEYHWCDSRIQKEIALVPDQLILRCLRNQPSKAWRWATQGKPSGRLCPDFSMHFNFLFSSYFSVPLFFPRKCFSLGFKTRYICCRKISTEAVF